MLDTLVRDLRFAVRTLAKSPGFTVVAVLTLAFGIGGAAAMHGFLQAVARFGQPTLPEPECISRLFTTSAPLSDERGQVSLNGYRRWSEAARSFEALAAYAGQTRILGTAGGEDEVGVLSITPSYFSLLKTPPLVGRVFTDEVARASNGRVAVLSERAWRSRFGGDSSVLGRTVDLDGQSYTVVGVIPERLGLVMPSTTLFVPLPEGADKAPVMVIGRRRASVSWAQVRAEMDAIGVVDGQAALYVRVLPILDDAGYRTRAVGLLAVGPAILVLLIGCGNVATVLLVRTVSREREVSIRLALGASRLRLATQLLVESWTIAAAAGALGVVLAFLGLRGIQGLIPASVDVRLGVDGRTLFFAGVATLLTPLIFGMAPLFHSLRVNLTDALRGSLHKPLFGVGQYHVRDVFAILEVGLSIALVVLALVFLSMFRAVRSLDLNFEGEGLVVARIRPQVGEGGLAGGVAADASRLLRERIAAIPGVTRATVGKLPFEGTLIRVGRSSGHAEVRARQVRVDRSYFETLRLPIVRGRVFGDGDAQQSAGVAVVSESLASRLWPDTDPLGQVLQVTDEGATEAVTVVGVSKDAVRLGRLGDLDVSMLAFRYSLYRPCSQGALPGFDVIARVRGRPASLFGAIRAAADSADRRLRIRSVTAMASTFDPTEREAPFPIYLLGGFGALALLLAAVGVFGVMNQLVEERRVELGIRLALGSSPGGLVDLVVRDGLIRVGVGAGVGLLALGVGVHWAFAGVLAATVPDPWLWLGVVAVVTLVATAACYVPARRAARVDPIEAMRCE
jgi:putative ABC transport system permease protein